jgi:hypothetical protein
MADAKSLPEKQGSEVKGLSVFISEEKNQKTVVLLPDTAALAARRPRLRTENAMLRVYLGLP